MTQQINFFQPVTDMFIVSIDRRDNRSGTFSIGRACALAHVDNGDGQEASVAAIDAFGRQRRLDWHDDTEPTRDPCYLVWGEDRSPSGLTWKVVYESSWACVDAERDFMAHAMQYPERYSLRDPTPHEEASELRERLRSLVDEFGIDLDPDYSDDPEIVGSSY